MTETAGGPTLFLTKGRLDGGVPLMRVAPVIDDARAATTRLWDATRDAQMFKENANAGTLATDEAYERRIKTVYEATGVQLANPRHSGSIGEMDAFSDPYAQQATPEENFEDEVKALAQRFPDKADIILGRGGMQEEARGVARDAEQGLLAAQADTEALPWWRKAYATLGGSVAGITHDPVQMGSLVLGAGGTAAKTVAGRILGVMMTEAAINAGVESVVQVAGQKWKREAGLEASLSGSLTQIGIAGLFGGGAGGLLQGGAELYKALGKPLPADLFERALAGDKAAVAQIADDIGVPPSQRQAAALQRAGADDAITDAVTPPQLAGERRMMVDAVAAIEADMPLPPALTQAVVAPARIANAPEGFHYFDAASLQTDARTFQYKEGGDSEGVTERLRDIERWDPDRAGVIIAFEDDAGKVFVADGHQRSGLARRIASQTGEQISLYGRLYRAADGFTPRDVRIIAALKNIAEGSGTTMDAAKVLRDGVDAKAANLPMTGAMLRDAAGLARLSDNAWTMVVNQVVNEKVAAAIGRLVDAPGLHAQFAEVLKAAGARDVGDSESMIRDLLTMPVATEMQTSLFGAEEISRMLLKERAAVRAAAVNALRNDMKAFKLVNDEEARLTEAGNLLNRDANTERARIDAILIDAIERLSSRTGPVGDAFNEAARAVAGGARAAGAARGFVDAVRREIGPDGRGILGIGRNGPGANAASATDTPDQTITPDTLAPARVVEPGQADAAQAARDALDAVQEPNAADLEAAGQANMFAVEPGADNLPQTLLPGVAVVEDADRIALLIDQPMQGGSAAPPAGGLFDNNARNQMDMMDMMPAGTDGDGNRLHASHGDMLADANQDDMFGDLVASCKGTN